MRTLLVVSGTRKTAGHVRKHADFGELPLNDRARSDLIALVLSSERRGKWMTGRA